MSKTSIPKNYHDLLGLYDTQRAIGIIKTIFQEKLCAALHLKRVTAPLFVLNGSGLNDDLNGVERPVSFDVPCLDERAEVVHSLAKWKRYALAEYGFRPGQGLVTMISIYQLKPRFQALLRPLVARFAALFNAATSGEPLQSEAALLGLIARLLQLQNHTFVASWWQGQRWGLLQLALRAGQCRRRRRDQLLFLLSCLWMALFLPRRGRMR